MRQAFLLASVVVLGLRSVSCTERFCENDMGCGLDERCEVETGKCFKVDGGVAYPVDGSVLDPDTLESLPASELDLAEFDACITCLDAEAGTGTCRDCQIVPNGESCRALLADWLDLECLSSQ